ncbi:MAG: hypothetical protein PHV61_09555, partial [Limnochordia bacterium]|nr:hypothetical protein [Limnochordia bacterium]
LTPFGLLQNPYHRCTESYADRQGGILCAHDQYLSFGWRYPVGRNPLQEVSMGLGLIEQDKILVTREDLASYHPYSRHHSAHLFSYEIGTRQGFLSCLYYLSQQDELVCQVQLDGFRAFVFWTIGTPQIQIEPLEHGWIYQGDQVIPLHSLQASVGLGAVVQNLPPGLVGREVEASFFEMAMARHSPPDVSPDASGRRRRKLARLMQEDMDFQRKCPTLIGDFPPHWQRGMIYDFETTRMCLFPPAGIFTDVWPTWMLSWPKEPWI